VVAMAAALGVSTRLQVAHWSFLCLRFAHIYLSSVLGCVSCAEYFSLRTTHGKDIITPRAKRCRGKVLTL
jgi:hypothetical protein